MRVRSRFAVYVAVVVVISVIVKPAEVVADVNTDAVTSHTDVETLLLRSCTKHHDCSKRPVVLTRHEERLSATDCC